MLRLIHNQTYSGGVPVDAILVDDIDDGLPNKVVHRLGTTADPKAYAREGYANKPKQGCYIQRARTPLFPAIAGYVTLNQTQRVTLSAGKGKIFKLRQTGLITVLPLVAADIVAPTCTAAHVGGGNLTITGTTMVSIAPDITSVIITGTGAITKTQAQIVAAGGTVGALSIVIPTGIIPGVANGTSFVQVQANEQLTLVVAVL
jgi:hypothetical protein